MNDTTFQGNGEITYVPVVADAKPKPITNAMKIRAMTDEELAEFIGDAPMHDICPHNCQNDLDRPCKVCALGWLKQEVNDGKEEKEENQPAK